MKELIDQVMSKAGINAEQAQGSVTAVVDFLKDKLPEPIASQLEKFIGGEEGEGGEASNPLDAAKDAIGGFFNKD